MNLFGQNEDGASAAAKAVRAYLGNYSGIEASWNNEWKHYTAEPSIARWHNCREQGYVISLRNKASTKQINIVFYEHRNTDDICALVWIGDVLTNPPTLADIPDGVFRSSADYTHSVDYKGAWDMALWIFRRLTTFWETGA